MKIHLLGDSLVQKRQGGHGIFYCGWGDMLPLFFRAETEILNFSLGGRSTRNFLSEGRFYDNGLFTLGMSPRNMGPALPKIEKGDYVFIQFMDNDDASESYAYRVNKHVPLGKLDENGIYPTVLPTLSMLSSTAHWADGYREKLEEEGIGRDEIEAILKKTEASIALCGEKYYAFDCGATYKGYLAYYISAIKEKGAFPILVVSGARFPMTGDKIQPVKGYRGGKDAWHNYPYVEAMKQAGSEQDVPVVDLFGIEKQLYEALGAEKAKYFHNLAVAVKDIGNIDAENLFGKGADYAGWVEDFDRRWEEGDFEAFDETHKNHFGAYIDAAFLAELLYEKDILREYISLVPHKKTEIPHYLQTEIVRIGSFFRHIKVFG